MEQVVTIGLQGLIDQLRTFRGEIARVEKRIVAWHRASDASRRLATIPGIGPITASAIAAAAGRHALPIRPAIRPWPGLTPRVHSSGGKERRVGISKQGATAISDAFLGTGAAPVIQLAH